MNARRKLQKCLIFTIANKDKFQRPLPTFTLPCLLPCGSGRCTATATNATKEKRTEANCLLFKQNFYLCREGIVKKQFAKFRVTCLHGENSKQSPTVKRQTRKSIAHGTVKVFVIFRCRQKSDYSFTRRKNVTIY